MDTILAALSALKLVPVVVLNDVEKAVPLARTLMEAGCNGIEITFRTEAAAESIARIAAEVPRMLVGAGTLLSPEQVLRAQSAGATFGVAPGFDPAVVSAAQGCGLPFVPGIATASEMSQALTQGCLFQKFFPAEPAGGTKLLKALLAAFRHTGVRIMPTGGIGADNIKEWLAIPEVVACGGSWICEAKLIDAGDWVEIGRRTREALSALR